MSTVKLQLGNATARLDASNPRLVVGRDQYGANLLSPDPSVSRRHAEVSLSGGRVFVADMGSSNGTWVNGAPVGSNPTELASGAMVFIGHVPLLVEWEGSAGRSATVMGALPPELMALIAARRQQAQTQQSTPASVSREVPQRFTYRRQASNDNGVLLIALPSDGFDNDTMLEGFAEFTAGDDETITSITVELVEQHRKGPGSGHVWDRVIVKQGPWKANRNDRVPMPFQLRIPAATSISGPDVQWEIQGNVDIAWGFDVECDVPITMHNRDVERIRDALGALDFRIETFESKPLGQAFAGRFVPPAQWQNQMGIDCINVDIQYLGASLEVVLEVDKRGAFSSDKKTKQVFDLAQLRATSQQQLTEHLRQSIGHLMQLR